MPRNPIDAGICSAPGCDRDAHYKADKLCQKHYFRKWRRGSLDLTPKSHKERVTSPAGYIWIYAPDHPLKHKTSVYVAEHRAVLYAALGDAPISCEICRKPLTWETCHVDHIDCDVANNKLSNLRPTCSTCNTRRGIGKPHTWSHTHAFTYQGETKTAHEWELDERVNVRSSTIIRRRKAGATDEEALFGAKKTHNGKRPVKKPPPPKSSRKNAVNLTIGGVTMTSAEWARQPGCSVTDSAIRMRLSWGWSHQDAVFRPNRHRRMARELEAQRETETA